MYNHKDIFSGHESFSLRESWIIKGIKLIKDRKEDRKEIFTSKNLTDVIDELGVGSNMVKSLKYWLEIYNVIDENIEITEEIEEMIVYDRYLQKKISLWLLHYFTIKPTRKRKAIIWNIIGKKQNYSSFSKELLIDLIDGETERKYTKNTIESSLMVYIKTYLYDNNDKVENPENNLSSPFSKLMYLQREEKNKTEEYKFRSIESKELNPYFVYLILYELIKYQNRDRINRKDAYSYFNTIIKMDSYNFELLLKEMENKELIIIDRAAGLNNINFTSKLSTKEVIKKIYEF